MNTDINSQEIDRKFLVWGACCQEEKYFIKAWKNGREISKPFSCSRQSNLNAYNYPINSLAEDKQLESIMLLCPLHGTT
jgi:hypothetical protein